MRRLHRGRALELLLHLGALAQPRRIDQPDLFLAPVPGDRHAVARDARLGPGDETLVFENAVEQRRLARVRTADERDADRLVRLRRRFRVGIERLIIFEFRLKLQKLARVFQLGLNASQRLEEIGHPLAMLGGDRRRIAKAETPGFHQPFISLLAFTLVGRQHDRLARLAQQLCEPLVDRRHAGARVVQEDRDVGLVDRDFGLLAHARF